MRVKKIHRDSKHEFRSQILPEQRELFARLANIQELRVLFITCCDSRVEPHIPTHTCPGDPFMIRLSSSLIPSAGAVHGGEATSTECAMQVLRVKHVIVCGHTNCGAMEALIYPNHAKDFPATRAWLDQAEPTRTIVLERAGDHQGDQALVPLPITVNLCVHSDLNPYLTFHALAFIVQPAKRCPA